MAISEKILLGPVSGGENPGRYFFSEHGFGELRTAPDTRPGTSVYSYRDERFSDLAVVTLPEEPWLKTQIITEDDGMNQYGFAIKDDLLAVAIINHAIGRAMGYPNYPSIGNSEPETTIIEKYEFLLKSAGVNVA